MASVVVCIPLFVLFRLVIVFFVIFRFTASDKLLENTEKTIKNGKSRETGNIDEEKQSKNTTQCV
jgi:hypothetical protein